MKVYKFGGASVKDPDGIRNLEAIVRKEPGKLVIVVSAFGKTTNALEQVLKTWMDGDEGYRNLLDNLYNYHDSVACGLFPGGNSASGMIDNSFALLREYLESAACIHGMTLQLLVRKSKKQGLWRLDQSVIRACSQTLPVHG